jgi:hypothetical protein
MKRQITTLFLAFAAILAVFTACSDDNSTNPAKTAGDPNDSQYVQAQIYTEQFVGTLADQAANGFDYMDWDGNRLANAASDSFSNFYDGESGWWVFYFHTDDSVSYDMTYTDSVKFEGPDGHQMYPDSATTESIDYRQSLNSDFYSDSTSLESEYLQNLVISGIQSELVNFNGASSSDLNTTGPRDTLTINYDATLNNITYDPVELDTSDDPHPQSGGMTLNMVIYAGGPQGSASVSWYVEITFFIDHLHAHFESGDNYWDWDEQYDG